MWIRPLKTNFRIWALTIALWSSERVEGLCSGGPGFDPHERLKAFYVRTSELGKCNNRKLSKVYWYCENYIDIAREFDMISIPLYHIETISIRYWYLNISIKIYQKLSIKTIQLSKIYRSILIFLSKLVAWNTQIDQYVSIIVSNFLSKPVHGR